MTTVWVGSLAGLWAATSDVRLDLGPQHPSRAGALRVDLTTDDGRIATASVRAGYEHRGAEKLLEVRDLRAALSLADRHDWQAPVFGELSLALSVESALGIAPPDRATTLRTLAAEHSRLHAQLGQLSWLETRYAGWDAHTTAARTGALREQLRRQFARWTGNRLHPMLTRIGGVSADVDGAWVADEATLASRCAELAGELEPLLANVPAGVGVAGAEVLDGWGLSGPFARAAGLDGDLRRVRPVAGWGDLEIPSPTRTECDARTRIGVAVDDVVTSARLVRSLLERLGGTAGAPLDTRLPKILRLPEGTFYTPLEAPWGEAGIRVVSRGEKTPWRALLRTPSLANVQALEALLPGAALDDVETIVASVGYVIGDVDK